jgi:penicillin-binding protein 1A
MPDSTPTLTGPASAAAEPTTLPGRNGDGPDRPKKPKRKIKKLRLFFVLLGLGILAFISTVFGMMMAVASEIPSLENSAEFRSARNSTLVADDGSPLARLTGNENRILIDPQDISPNIKNAVIAIEDKRFYTHKGVDWRGMVRAAFADFTHHGAVQGGSTITEQFVKNALAAQNNRTIFEKLREAALAYHLEKQWSKQKILGEYLNTVYFGNGAYGIESAMRTYFGGPQTHYDPNERAARNATPDQAALLAGIIASPSAFNPVTNRKAALDRRNLVLKLMLQQHMISNGQYQQALIQALPSAESIHPPRPDSSQPYYSTWVTQQLVDRLGSGRVFGGGLKIRTSLDPDLQAAAEQAINGRLAGVGPSASLVAIDNHTGEVRAMVGGNDYATHPFNIATDGHRQPGSSFKTFTLIEAPRQRVAVRACHLQGVEARAVPGTQLRGLIPRLGVTRQRLRLLRQLRLRARGYPGGRAPHRPAGKQDGNSHTRLAQPRDHARRAEGGAEPARDGLRLLDDRERRQARDEQPAGVEGRPGRG